MRALRLYPQGLVLEEIARPEPGPSEVLVRVQAAAITRDELTWPGDRLREAGFSVDRVLVEDLRPVPAVCAIGRPQGG